MSILNQAVKVQVGETTCEQHDVTLQTVKTGLAQQEETNGAFTVADYNPNDPNKDKKTIPDIIHFLNKRYALLVIEGQVLLVDRFGTDSFGHPIGLKVVSAPELKKQYSEIRFKVKTGDKESIHNVFDLYFMSGRRTQLHAVTRPAQLAIAAHEINLMAPLPLSPQLTDHSHFNAVLHAALASNGQGPCALFNDFMAHSAYPRYAGIGLGIELQGALDTPFGELLTELFHLLFGPRFLRITHLNQLDYLHTRLNRPTLVMIDESVLEEIGKAADKFLLNYIASDETQVKLGQGKPFIQPNYLHIIVLSQFGCAWSPLLARRFSTLSVDPVPETLIAMARQQLFEQDGAVGVGHGLAVLAQSLKNDFKARISHESHAFNEFHNNILLQFLIIQLEKGELAGKTIATHQLWESLDAYLKNKALTYKYNRIAAGRELKRLLPGLGKSKVNEKAQDDQVAPALAWMQQSSQATWVPSYDFPDLVTCRAAIDRYLSYPWSWQYALSETTQVPDVLSPEQTLLAPEEAEDNLLSLTVSELEGLMGAEIKENSYQPETAAA